MKLVDDLKKASSNQMITPFAMNMLRPYLIANLNNTHNNNNAANYKKNSDTSSSSSSTEYVYTTDGVSIGYPHDTIVYAAQQSAFPSAVPLYRSTLSVIEYESRDDAVGPTTTSSSNSTIGIRSSDQTSAAVDSNDSFGLL